jgi:hypothetical protein
LSWYRGSDRGKRTLVNYNAEVVETSITHDSRILVESLVLARIFFFSKSLDTSREHSIILVLDSTTRVHHWSKPTIDMKLKKRENPGGLHVPSEEVIVGNQIKMLSTR